MREARYCGLMQPYTDIGTPITVRYVLAGRSRDVHDVMKGTRLTWYRQWISWFLSSKGNEYFCEVEEDFILDRFNLTGLNSEVQNYSQALDLITDNLGTHCV